MARTRAGWLGFLWVVSMGCKPGMLPDSTVEATSENKEIAAVVELYRKALETRDPAQVLRLVSAEYFEDMGTADPSDDYNFDGLRQHMAEDMARVQALRVSVRLIRVEIDGDRAYCDYRFQTRSLAGFPAGDQWITRTDDNRLSFRRESGRWMIVSGL
ncbi:MAG: nuclear transport factor 2 family protein [Deltaproteobacteria bacterium]|nr:nuclear transport factor 2 family protein [Deltaproteobacteria bacterium]